MWWVEGKTKKRNNYGKRTWMPLYCAPSEYQAKIILRQVLLADASKAPDPKMATEAKMLEKEFRDFRIQNHHEHDATKRRRANPSGGNSLTCTECGGTDLKRVKRGDQKLWKCESCKNRWPRESRIEGEGSTKPSKPRKTKKRSVHA